VATPYFAFLFYVFCLHSCSFDFNYTITFVFTHRDLIAAISGQGLEKGAAAI
jgi:hypothetical protein